MGRPGLVLDCLGLGSGRLGSVLGESGPVRVHLGLVLRCPGRFLRKSWDRLGCLGLSGQSWKPEHDFGRQFRVFKQF